MIKLQNDFTTPEQSKRLLELGVPADSADMIWVPQYKNDKKCGYLKCPFVTENYKEEYLNDKDIFPCWSVGRLIEIWLHCNKFSIDSASEPITIGLIDFIDNFIDDFIHLIKKAVGSKHIDFSKLED